MSHTMSPVVDEPVVPPTVSELSASIVAVADLLASYMSPEDSDTSKMKKIARYADTFFGGEDLNRIRQELSNRPDLVKAIVNRDLDSVMSTIAPDTASGQTAGQAAALINTIHQLSQRVSTDDMDTLWFELNTWCLLTTSSAGP
jgi:hypothetical protein